MKKVMFLHKYSHDAAAFRYRFAQYFPFLQEHGLKIASQSLLGETYLAEKYTGRWLRSWRVLAAYFRRIFYVRAARRPDLMVVYMEMLPYLPFWLEKLL